PQFFFFFLFFFLVLAQALTVLGESRQAIRTLLVAFSSLGIRYCYKKRFRQSNSGCAFLIRALLPFFYSFLFGGGR
ncbi:hypothetical protein BJX65DRAFT_273082, partial [Aspergillus insuetus]